MGSCGHWWRAALVGVMAWASVGCAGPEGDLANHAEVRVEAAQEAAPEEADAREDAPPDAPGPVVDVSFEEYEASVFAYQACMVDRGASLTHLSFDDVTKQYDWGVPVEHAGADAVCYRSKLEEADMSWQMGRDQRLRAAGLPTPRDRFIRCHRMLGMEFDPSWNDGELSINLLEAGIDSFECGR